MMTSLSGSPSTEPAGPPSSDDVGDIKLAILFLGNCSEMELRSSAKQLVGLGEVHDDEAVGLTIPRVVA